jgi:hypothetical protein
MADVPIRGSRKYWTQRLASLKSESHTITNKYPAAASIVQQVHKVLSDIENLAGCTQARVEESSQWTCIVNSAEENIGNFCKDLDRKLFFSALYYKHMVTLSELKSVLKVSAQAGQSGAVNKISKESRAQDDDENEMVRTCRLHWVKRNACRVLVVEPEG